MCCFSSASQFSVPTLVRSFCENATALLEYIVHPGRAELELKWRSILIPSFFPCRVNKGLLGIDVVPASGIVAQLKHNTQL
jgi:hypothetical protein